MTRPEDEYVFDDDETAETAETAEATDTATPDDTDSDTDAATSGDTDAPDDAESDAGTARHGDAERPDRTPRRRVLVPALLVLVTVALVVVGTVLLVGAAGDRSKARSGNAAVIDQVSTTQVVAQVSQALDRVFTYDYKDPSTTQQAAASLLTGDAATQYKTLFDALQSKAPGEQLTLTAKTVTAGVSSLSGSTAQLLVFLDQTSTRASDNVTSQSAAQLQVTAVKQGDDWKVSELLPL